MAGFDDAALRVVHQDDKPLTTKTIDADDPGGVHLKVVLFSFHFFLLLLFQVYSIPNWRLIFFTMEGGTSQNPSFPLKGIGLCNGRGFAKTKP